MSYIKPDVQVLQSFFLKLSCAVELNINTSLKEQLDQFVKLVPETSRYILKQNLRTKCIFNWAKFSHTENSKHHTGGKERHVSAHPLKERRPISTKQSTGPNWCELEGSSQAP